MASFLTICLLCLGLAYSADAPENCVFDGADSFSEGMAEVLVGDKRGYIDKACKIVIEPQFDGADSFSEGLAAVTLGDKYGYINKAGEVAIEPQFGSGAFRFFDGLARVTVGNKYAYINTAGEVVIELDYRMVFPFSEGRAVVYLGDYKWGYIDKSGDRLRAK
jgi:hypothetical protein